MDQQVITSVEEALEHDLATTPWLAEIAARLGVPVSPVAVAAAGYERAFAEQIVGRHGLFLLAEVLVNCGPDRADYEVWPVTQAVLQSLFSPFPPPLEEVPDALISTEAVEQMADERDRYPWRAAVDLAGHRSDLAVALSRPGPDPDDEPDDEHAAMVLELVVERVRTALLAALSATADEG